MVRLCALPVPVPVPVPVPPRVLLPLPQMTEWPESV